MPWHMRWHAMATDFDIGCLAYGTDNNRFSSDHGRFQLKTKSFVFCDPPSPGFLCRRPQVFAPSNPNVTRVVLSTDIAESSITLPNVVAVGGGPPAEGPRGGGSPRRLYKAPTDNRKPRQTIESPDRLYKAPEKIIQSPNRQY